MASSISQQFSGLRCSPVSSTRLTMPSAAATVSAPKRRSSQIVCGTISANMQTKERLKLKELFEEAYERCRTAPMEGVAFTVEDFHTAIEKYDFNSEIGTKSISNGVM